ncbi:hypothetical protein AK812_SmicGene34817 [Symbiodinium microadriaticum]|uniref:Uncharacterized protein n=1 Tax=Symbiodinium microadriaticum TaxID=2951 RepID=A0A1Q9CMZ9_SYMMI|nr:hypothetical protein AK812_SmicGene34817 [Symbiodinium microadriaticum]
MTTVKLRVTNQQLFLEPMVEELLPDGCMRVEICVGLGCPMVFLGRTARMKTFQFQKDLRVGEHEQFFYSNAYQGVQVNTMSAAYVKRRERMPELMANAFEKLGFERAPGPRRMEDYDELLDKAPPVPFAQLFAVGSLVVLTTADAVGRAFRSVLRSQQGPRAGVHNALQEEQDAHQELKPEGSKPHQHAVEHRVGKTLIVRLSPAATGQEATTDQLLQAFGLLRDFHFRWLLVTRQDVFVRAEGFLGELQQLEPAGRKAFQRLDPHFFVLPRDVFTLVSVFGELSSIAAGISAWMHAFAVERRQLLAAKFRAMLQLMAGRPCSK